MTPVLLEESSRLDSMRVEAVLKSSTISLGPKATEGQILGYNNVRSVFEGSWVGKKVTIKGRIYLISAAKYRPHRPQRP